MKDAIINYLPELFGGILLAMFTFWLTKRNEQLKAKDQLSNQKMQFDNEKEKMKLQHDNEKDRMMTEYEAKLKEQELKLKHEMDLLERQHQLEMEKYSKEIQDQDLRSIFNGEYNMGDISDQLEGLEKLWGKAEKMDKRLKSGTFKNAKHPANKKR